MDGIKHKIVFIVEDNQMYSMMLDYTLSKDSVYRFVSFSSGEECIKNLHMDPSMVILDYGLPGMNGMETFKEIKKHNPNIPVVILTETKDWHLAKEFLDEGVYDYLVKESDAVKQISDIVNKALLNSQTKKEQVKEKNAMLKMVFGVMLFVVFVVGVILFIYRQ